MFTPVCKDKQRNKALKSFYQLSLKGHCESDSRWSCAGFHSLSGSDRPPLKDHSTVLHHVSSVHHQLWSYCTHQVAAKIITLWVFEMCQVIINQNYYYISQCPPAAGWVSDWLRSIYWITDQYYTIFSYKDLQKSSSWVNRFGSPQTQSFSSLLMWLCWYLNINSELRGLWEEEYS